MTPQAELNAAAELLADRMRVFKRTAQQARERDEDVSSMAPAEFWASADEFALASFDLAKERLTGAQRLPGMIPMPDFPEDPLAGFPTLNRRTA
jgi:hypothetical protein